MSDTRRGKHVPPKEYARNRPRKFTKDRDPTLKQGKQKRAADKVAWRKELT